MFNIAGKSFGRYHIVESLGEGGMASVYKAYDTRLERNVAIKIILPSQQQSELFISRFEREAKALAKFAHPNIVPVIDYGEEESVPYLVMPFLPGGTLKDRIKGPVPWKEAARILAQVARALEYAHEQGIVHRDIKPANVLVTESGLPMLSDFGLAKLLEEEKDLAKLTGSGVGVGTPDYMSPEQAKGEQVDHRTDIYSLGVVFYEMITGRTPFQADTPVAVVIKVITEPLPRPRQFMPDLPEAVEQVVFKAVAHQANERYTDMGAFAAALEELVETSAELPTADSLPVPDVTSEPPSIPEPSIPAEPASKSKTMLGVSCAVLGVGGVGLLLLLLLVGFLRFRSVRIAKLTATAAVSVQTTPGGVEPQDVIVDAEPTDMEMAEVETAATEPAPVAASPTDAPAVEAENPAVIPTLPLDNGTMKVSEVDGMTLVRIPAGTFLTGSSGGARAKVHLDEYWIDRTLVTNAMYVRCVEAGACLPPASKESYLQDTYYGYYLYDDYPVIYVNWEQAHTYCQWAGRRLPTEAEWEKAARGEDGGAFPWGEAATCIETNFNGCVGDTTPVYSYPLGASPYGVLDMVGNAFQWVADWFVADFYPNGGENPTGPERGTKRVERGSSFFSGERIALISYRNGSDPTDATDQRGFRCASD